MTFFVDNVFTSLGMAVAFTVAAWWVAARPQSAAARRSVVAVALAYLIASIYAVPQAISWVLFTRGLRPFTASDIAPGRTAVVVLGGGTDTAHGIGDTTLAVASGDGLERVLEAARVFKMTHAEWLIASGGRLDVREERDAIVMRDELVQMGFRRRVSCSRPSRGRRTSRQSSSRRCLQSLGAERVILVTSDVHMPRSLGAFRAYGVQAIPAIATTGANDPLRRRMVSTLNGLWRSRQVSHELFGIVYYAVREWWK